SCDFSRGWRSRKPPTFWASPEPPPPGTGPTPAPGSSTDCETRNIEPEGVAGSKRLRDSDESQPDGQGNPLTCPALMAGRAPGHPGPTTSPASPYQSWGPRRSVLSFTSRDFLAFLKNPGGPCRVCR